LLTACSLDTKPALQPVPATIIHVPVRVPLPAGLTDPCDRPESTPIKTDADAVMMGLGWKTTAICNENKLRAIAKAQKAPAQ
jgi:hypothetical protein